LRRALSGENEDSFEGLARTPGGRDFPVRIRGRRGLLRGRTYQILAVRNLAPERRLEEEFAHLFELSPDLICILGYDGYFKRLSPSWEKTLGFTLDELYAQPYSDFLHPEDVPPTHVAVENAGQERHTRNFENRYRCKDGSYRWLQWNGCNLPGGDQMLGMGRDVTEEKK
jgi:PAS domain S-box-containing protein